MGPVRHGAGPSSRLRAPWRFGTQSVSWPPGQIQKNCEILGKVKLEECESHRITDSGAKVQTGPHAQGSGSGRRDPSSSAAVPPPCRSESHRDRGAEADGWAGAGRDGRARLPSPAGWSQGDFPQLVPAPGSGGDRHFFSALSLPLNDITPQILSHSPHPGVLRRGLQTLSKSM